VSLDLPRLVASGPEIEACGRAWGGAPLLLRGADACRGRLLQALESRPAVVHIAAHVLESSQRPSYGLIALSPGPQGAVEVLTPYEIARWHVDVPLVVLNGCSSARGAALPGTGLLGLTRAWLAAGVANVLASRWPTPDDGGALFASFYRHLHARPSSGAASALQAAQNEMRAAGGPEAHPRYWGAYFVIGAPGAAGRN
jgi:CHAT domain-containing protein